ncbi:MAG: ankyrin repeat domain-containing protein [Phycisphaerae bacterium]|nr:ankyrin repeat domain-containing protein [Phycisphaerae bacterium]
MKRYHCILPLQVLTVATCFVLATQCFATDENPPDATLLLDSIRQGRTNDALNMLAGTVDLNRRFEADMTLLHFAAAKGNTAVMEVIIERRADVNVMAKNGFTPLHMAAMYGHPDAARLLIAAGAIVNAHEGNGTPLHWCAWKGQEGNFAWRFRPVKDAPEWKRQVAVAQLLLDNGADVNIKCKDGSTALDNAFHYDRGDLIELLRAHGGTYTSRTWIYMILIGLVVFFGIGRFLVGRR